MKKRALAALLSLIMIGAQVVPIQASSIDAQKLNQTEDIAALESDLVGNTENISTALDGIEVSENEISENEVGAISTLNIDETFPDPVFQSYIKVTYDADSDGSLSVGEIEGITEIRVACYDFWTGREYVDNTHEYEKIKSLKGVEKLPNVEFIDCSGNYLSTLDVSGMTKLSQLDCQNNPITKLNVANCNKLTELSVQYTNLPYVHVPNTSCYVLTQALDQQGMYDTTAIYYSNTKSIRLSDLGMSASNMINDIIKGGKIKNGVLTIDDDSNQVTYAYKCAGSKGLFFMFAIRYVPGDGIGISFGDSTDALGASLERIRINFEYTDYSSLSLNSNYELYRSVNSSDPVKIKALSISDITSGYYLDEVEGGTGGKTLTYYLQYNDKESNEKKSDEITETIRLYDNTDEFEKDFREILKNRTEGQLLFVKEDRFYDSYYHMYVHQLTGDDEIDNDDDEKKSLYSINNMEKALFDTYREREGMKPDEGEYLEQQVGKDTTSAIMDIVQYDYTSASLYNENSGDCEIESYMAFRVTPQFCTTKQEEEEVTNKIDSIVKTPGGALYKYYNDSDNYSTYEKAKACYQYVRSHVKYLSDGNWKTHSCYAALINGKSTCQGYSLLYYRLLRELGISNKILMGTDSGAHTYNIIQVGDYFYYSDPSSSSFSLKGENSFKKAPLQSRFTTYEYKKAYLSKISTTNYSADNDPTIPSGIRILMENEEGEKEIVNDQSLYISITDNDSLSLNAIVLPDTATNKNIIWKSSKESVATIDEKGNVSPVSVGDTVITAVAEGKTSVMAKCNVSIIRRAEEIQICGTENMVIGKKTKLTAKLMPYSTTVQKVKWTTPNDGDTGIISFSKGSISKDITLTARARGDMTIRAVAIDGSDAYTDYIVHVYDPVNNVKIVDQDKKNITGQTIKIDSKMGGNPQSIIISAQALGKNSDSEVCQKFDWESKKTNVAEIKKGENGEVVITAIAPGKSVITATAQDGTKKKASITVEVVQSEITFRNSNTIAKGKSMSVQTYGPKVTYKIVDANQDYLDAKIISLKGSKLTVKKEAEPGTAITVGAFQNGQDDPVETQIITVVDAADSMHIYKKEEEAWLEGNIFAFERDQISEDSDDGTLKLKAVAKNSDMEIETSYIWNVSNQKIAKIESVNENYCVIRPLRPGKVNIMVKTADGSNKSKKITLSIAGIATSVEINGEEEVQAGQSIQLKAYVKPVWAQNKKVNWSYVAETPNPATQKLKKNDISIKNGKLSVKKGVFKGTKITVIAETCDGSMKKDEMEISVK